MRLQRQRLDGGRGFKIPESVVLSISVREGAAARRESDALLDEFSGAALHFLDTCTIY